jgi:DNA-binding response OmpR family regulator
MDTAQTAPRVLIVDRSQESREILRAALERRGMRIFEAQAAGEGLELVESQRPDLILLDVDGAEQEAPNHPRQLALAADQQATPIIVLGTVRRAALAPGEFVRKPYHYAPLIRKIEALLAKAA